MYINSLLQSLLIKVSLLNDQIVLYTSLTVMLMMNEDGLTGMSLQSSGKVDAGAHVPEKVSGLHIHRRVRSHVFGLHVCISMCKEHTILNVK